MQLQRGTCIFCINTKIVKPPYNQEVYKIITTLLSKGLLNLAEFEKVQLLLKFCPICYHKLIIAERTRANINSKEISYEASNDKCLLCKSKKNLFEINEWSGVKEKLEDFTISRNNTAVTCSDCFYYLEIKNEIKTKLFSKYPELRVKPESSNANERRVKPKFIPKIKLKSVPLFVTDRGKASRKRKFSKITNDSSFVDDSLTDTNINLNSVKKFKPLKDSNVFRNHRLIKSDFKFLNQVPYVLLSTTQLTNNRNADKTTELNELISTPATNQDADCLIIDCKNLKKRNGKFISRALKQENDLYKRGIEKHLVVNVTRIRTEKYIREADANPDIKDFNEELTILQNLYPTVENDDVNSSCIITDDSFEEPESKNKRKSVSFAEDKNVEIEYFENESNPKYRNSSKDSFEALSKGYNKGILKRDSNVDENIDNSENPIIPQEINQTLEAQRTKGNSKDEDELNDKQDEINNSDSNSDNEDLFKSCKSNKGKSLETEEIVPKDNDEADDVTDNENSNNINQENRRDKPKPFSKRKRRKTVTEDRGDESNSVDTQFLSNSEEITKKLDEASDSISGNTSDSDMSNEKINESITEKQNEDEKTEEDTSESNPNEEKETKNYLEESQQDENSNDSANKEESGRENENDNEDEEINGSEEICNSTLNISSQGENAQSIEENANTSDNENKGEPILREEENLEDIICTGSKIKSTTKNDNDFENKESIDNQNISNSSEPCEALNRSNIYPNNNGSEDLNSRSISHNNLAIDNIDNDIDNVMNIENEQKSSHTADKDNEDITEETNISTECKRLSVTADEFDEFEKNADYNITEADSENINSILSNMFPSEIPDESILEDTSCVKKNTGEDELSNINKEKKKKKVTFCDDDM